MKETDTNLSIKTVSQLLLHADRLERDAALQYAALADQMETHNNQELADFFLEMSKIEWEHVSDISKISGEMNLQSIEAHRRWVGLSSGEAPEFGDMHYLQQPYHAIQAALKAEKENVKFYSDVAENADSAELRELAVKLLAEERQHVCELEKWLGRYLEPEPGWDHDMDPPVAE